VDEINAAMQSILQLLPDSDAEGVVIIALDSEWNVEVSEHGYVTGWGQTAILQIAFGRQIYIIQASHSFYAVIPSGNCSSDWSNTGQKATASHPCVSPMQSKNSKG
jgi:hypothetical protein